MVRWVCVVFLVGLLLACGSGSAVQPTVVPSPIAMPVPTDAPAPTIAAAPPTAEVLATLATDAPEPTSAPAAAPALTGAAPKGSDCPADHPVKGNIRDRNPNKGEKIYHLPGDNGYAQTKPERCFADAAEAEAAGYRAVK
jgi:hypothetical protein